MKDEAGEDRYLLRVLQNAKQFCDEIVVLDDGSTDDTVKICEEEGCIVERTVNGGWWKGGTESSARQRLWQLACEHATPKGWVYVFDADHELLGLTPAEFRALLESEQVDSWAFPLWDCWDSEEWHRVDGFWQAWRLPRPWLARALPGDWGNRGVHAGHLPFRNWTPGLAPAGAGVRHLGYVKLEHRKVKIEKYLALGDMYEAVPKV